MAGRDNSKALPSRSVKRTKDNNCKAAVKIQASSSGDAEKPNSVRKPMLDMSKVEKHKSGKAATEHKSSGPGTSSEEAQKQKTVWKPIMKIYHGKSNEI